MHPFASDKVGTTALLKDLNHRAVLEVLAQDGPKSRVELSQRLRLSQTSVSRIADALLQAGIVVEGRRVASKIGRRRTLLDIEPTVAVVAGLSVSAHYVRLELSDLKGKRLDYCERPTAKRSAKILVDQVVRLVRASLVKLGLPEGKLAAVTLGINGAWDENRRMAHSAPNVPFVEGVDLLGLLRSAFWVPDSAVQVGNDVNYAALGELARGAGRGHDSLFYLNLGSGVGGGVIVNGRLHLGVHGFAGELGYLPVLQGGRQVILENVVSTAAMAQRAASLGLGHEADDLLRGARDGVPEAVSAVREISGHLALCLCAVIAAIDPEIIVLGGIAGRYCDVLLPGIQGSLDGMVPFPTPVVGTKLGIDAPLTGAVSQALGLARNSLVTQELAVVGGQVAGLHPLAVDQPERALFEADARAIGAGHRTPSAAYSWS